MMKGIFALVVVVAVGVLAGAVSAKNPPVGDSQLAGSVSPLVVTAPGNDAFASATDLGTASSGCQSGTNLGATAETDEVTVTSYDTDSVWYSWTAPSSTDVTFRVFLRSMEDSTLGIYTGSAVGSLTEVDTNDDVYGLASQVTFLATAETTYMIRVAAYQVDEDGTFALAWGDGCPAPNDDFADAASISGEVGSLTGQTNEAATVESGELDTHEIQTGDGTTSDLGGTSVWYSWTAPANVTGLPVCVQWRPDGVNLYAILGVYTGTLGDLTEVAYADEEATENCSTALSFDAESGTTYMIGVGGEEGTTGAFDLIWGDTTPPTTEIAAATPSPTSSSTVTFDVMFSEPVTGFTSDDVDLSLSTAGTGTVEVTDTGDHMLYTVDVAATSDGWVIATIPWGSAVDLNNNESLESGEADIYYDSQAPTWNPTKVKVQGAKATITFSATGDGVSYACSLDGSYSYETCSSPYMTTTLSKGEHILSLRATNSQSHESVTDVTFTIKSGRIKA